jgi:hypothetical protein
VVAAIGLNAWDRNRDNRGVRPVGPAREIETSEQSASRFATSVEALAALVTTRASLLALISTALALLTAVALICFNLASARWVQALHHYLLSPNRIRSLVAMRRERTARALHGKARRLPGADDSVSLNRTPVLSLKNVPN